MVREYRFYVYILQSSSRRALYIGMTNNLRQRVFDHKAHRHEGFTDQYNAVRLVHWERYDDVHKAIAREKQLKRWRREKKLWLIARFNPGWKNLAADWFDNTPAQPSNRVMLHSKRRKTKDQHKAKGQHKVPRLVLAFARNCARDDKAIERACICALSRTTITERADRTHRVSPGS